MENKYKIAYHITKKSNLPNIQRNGLKPRIGRRSNSVDEHTKLLCFTNSLRAVCVWKDRLYEDISFDDLAVLSFDLEGIQFGQRYDSAGDFFTEETISPEKINIIQITEKDNPHSIVSLENIRSVLGNEQYQIVETKITEASLENTSRNKEEIIDELAAYEHKKWKECQDIIHWHAKRNEDRTLEIAQEDIEQMNKYSSLDYDQTDEIHKKEIRKSVLETFYIMQESGLTSQLDLSDEEVLTVLERTEHTRRNNWNKYMLSLCKFDNGVYTIPIERVNLWEKEMATQYTDLTDYQKELDKKEVYNIFSEIEKYKNLDKKIPEDKTDTVR